MTERLENGGDEKPGIRLSLEGSDAAAPSPAMPEKKPVAGYLAIVFGLLGIFAQGFIFVPLAVIASFVALFSGQVIWGIFGLILSFVGLVTSPLLLTFLGLGALVAAVGI
ncbi:MAG: hypothetical protein HQ504_05300 [Rhodospirillaceae bacterium]|nr:hypothetical protein [Rhodospirillaceae bacterium]